MAENLRPAVPPPASDLAGTEGCGSAVTRASSDLSASTVDGSKACLRSNGNARSGQTTEWTDEKHSLYLDSLESSFVNQLHSSMGLFGRRSKVKMMELNSFQELAMNAYNSSDEYTVLQDGCWRKRNFGRHQLLLDAAAESRDILENPWICHFKSAGQQHDVTSSDLWNRSVDSSKGIHLRGKRKASHGLATSSKRLSACHPWLQDSVGGITEVSDQNFIDEEQENKSSRVSRAKKLKTKADTVDATNTDQCVPSGKFLMKGDSSVSNTNLQKEKKGHAMNDYQKGLRVVSPEHDVNTSLDES